jgi:imidazoleglycerol phosphate synthase glutamine amidotransferase subunit HisH
VKNEKKYIKKNNMENNNFQLLKQEIKKIENIDSKIKDIGWYKVDCKKYFKTIE